MLLSEFLHFNNFVQKLTIKVRTDANEINCYKDASTRNIVPCYVFELITLH